MIHKLLFPLIPGLLLLGCYEPERRCEDFRNGTFTFSSEIEGELKTTTFTRNDSMEIDYFEGRADTSEVRWINDCEYVLRKLNPGNAAEKKSVHIKILSTSGDSYTFEYNIVGSPVKSRGTARKAE